MSYDDDVHPYTDLVLGRVDAVLLDHVLAERRRRSVEGFTIQPEAVAIGHYVGVLAARQSDLRDRINEVLKAAMRDGTLERIFRKWAVWNDDQATSLHRRCWPANPSPPVTVLQGAQDIERLGTWETTRRYLPLLLRAAA